MSVEDPNPAPSAPQENNPGEGPSFAIRFPPFPKAPEGTTIIPFKDFKEGGICMEPGLDDEEVDSHGIATIPLRSRHKIDACKTNSKRKRNEEQAQARKKAGLSTQRTWWEQWDDTELIRFSVGFNPHSSRFERLHAAATDFTNGRGWPVNFKSETGPKFIWEKFQRYIGVQGSNVPKDKNKDAIKEDEDEMSDDDDDDDVVDAREDEVETKASVGNRAIIKDSELPRLIAKANAQASNEEKLIRFFNDPERSIKVFMTSYAREQGYIWYDVNLECMPRLLLFFVNFLLRSKVLPEIERNLRRATDVLKLALLELPVTSNISKAFPDKFSLACSACWGRKNDDYYSLDLSEVITVPDKVIAPTESEQPETVKAIEQGNPASALDEDAPPWGNDPHSGWGRPHVYVPEEDTTTRWLTQDAEEDNLLKFLGPTALPLTHKTGVVERSMRKIVSVTPPNPNPPHSAPQPPGVAEPDAEAVEVDLDKLFTKVVLGPMPLDWDCGESPVYSRPTIMKSSEGPVVEDGKPSELPQESTTPKPHDPVNDNITLLVQADADNVALLCEGMALGGIWVQLVRQGEVVKKKKKGKSKKVIPNYWYLDWMDIVVPSFWSVPAE